MQQKIQIQSRSDPSRSYVVELNDNGKHRCSCPGWIYHGQRKPCKHILEAVAHQKNVTPYYVATAAAAKPEVKPPSSGSATKSVKSRISRSVVTDLLREKLLPILKRNCERYEVCGSYRRGKATVGDVDLVVVCSDEGWQRMTKRLTDMARQIVGGPAKMSYDLDGVQVDVNRTRAFMWGSALCHFTGPMEENVRLRKIALQKGYSLSQHGFGRDGKVVKHCADEKAVYAFLKQPYLRPTERGEV